MIKHYETKSINFIDDDNEEHSIILPIYDYELEFSFGLSLGSTSSLFDLLLINDFYSLTLNKNCRNKLGLELFVHNKNPFTISSYFFYIIDEEQINNPEADISTISKQIEEIEFIEELINCLRENNIFYFRIGIDFTKGEGHEIYANIKLDNDKYIFTLYDRFYLGKPIYKFFKKILSYYLIDLKYDLTCSQENHYQQKINEIINRDEILLWKNIYNLDIQDIDDEYLFILHYNITKSCSTYSLLYFLLSILNPLKKIVL